MWRSETKPNEILKAQFRKENYLRKITYARGINQKFILRNLLEIKFSFGILAIIKMLEGKSFLFFGVLELSPLTHCKIPCFTHSLLLFRSTSFHPPVALSSNHSIHPLTPRRKDSQQHPSLYLYSHPLQEKGNLKIVNVAHKITKSHYSRALKSLSFSLFCLRIIPSSDWFLWFLLDTGESREFLNFLPYAFAHTWVEMLGA